MNVAENKPRGAYPGLTHGASPARDPFTGEKKKDKPSLLEQINTAATENGWIRDRFLGNICFRLNSRRIDVTVTPKGDVWVGQTEYRSIHPNQIVDALKGEVCSCPPPSEETMWFQVTDKNCHFHKALLEETAS